MTSTHPTRRTVLLGSVAATAAATAVAPPAVARARTGGQRAGNPLVEVPAGASEDEVVALAATVTPEPAQLAWQQRDRTAFSHFGMNTFTDREWGSGAEPETRFSPAREADVDQWMRALRAAGCRLAMLTVKHHDGFVLYPTRYSNHSIIASPYWLRLGSEPSPAARRRREHAQQRRADDPSAYWQARDAGDRNPAGDLFRMYADSARRHGLKVGVYLSPADGCELTKALWDKEVAQARADKAAGRWLSIEQRAALEDADAGLAPQGQGRYGNGSPKKRRTIPTLVPGDDRTGRIRSGQLPSFHYDLDDYNAYYLNQIYELLTEYGTIDEFWLDGANPWAGLGAQQDYDMAAFFEVFHALAPGMRAFEGPSGFRWVGNEEGRALPDSWSVVPMTGDPRIAYGEPLLVGGASNPHLGSRAHLADPTTRFLQWLPAECDVSLRPGWFWHAGQTAKTPEELVEIYRASVGRNATMLLNVPAATDGRIPQADVAALTAYGDAIARTEADDLLADGSTATPSRSADDTTTPTVEVTLRVPVTADQFQLGEDIAHGQQVESAVLDAMVNGQWRTIAEVTTIGLRRICQLEQPVTTDRLRLRVLAARGTARINRLSAYRSVPVRN